MTPQCTVLAEQLQAQFPWHYARIKFLAAFILAVLALTTVNLSKLANALNGKTKRQSNYRRLQRFFKDFEVSQRQIATVLLALVPKQALWIVSIDRTNWKLGKVNLNILMAGIVYRGIVIPLAWMLLKKQGNSNTQERKLLMSKLLAVLDQHKIACVVADREFIGDDWFTSLEEHDLVYAIRIRENALVTGHKGDIPVRKLFADLAIEEERHLRKPRRIYGHRLYLSVLRLKDELLIVASNRKDPSALTSYKRRWGIEVLFAAFKSRGFDLEQTHLIEQERLEKLIALLALAMLWALLVGTWESEHHPIVVKKHGRKQTSLFRLGLDQLQYVLLNIKDQWNTFYHYLNLIIEPVPLTS